ncbi:hypothetical protein BDW59DRAFT_156578 [Aspergillus cavernicola]|uniref:Uncharacterized protein n=1 Tax=Aspergillus cavernicola TaxID=176166 RepID=A0ABR4J174_9EURO
MWLQRGQKSGRCHPGELAGETALLSRNLRREDEQFAEETGATTVDVDTKVLREIAGWLGASYQSKILLHGIIYLHWITDIRMQVSARKNLILFRQLCGQEALKNIILATTMWDKVAAEEGARREKELIDTPEFWGWMLGKGSTCH